MNLQGMSLNLVTLGGLAIAAGRVVDDSIVVMENVYRHIQDGDNRPEAAYAGTREVAMPITIATLTTIAVFAPLGFIGGIVSEFFLPFALVITYALLASLVVALTAVPVLASFLIKRHATDTAEELLSQRIVRIYTPTITWALGHRLYTILGALVLFVSSLFLLIWIPVGFLPGGGQNALTIEIEAPPTTPRDTVVGYLDSAEARLEELRVAGEVDAYSSRIGGGSFFDGPAGGLTQINITARLTEDTDADAMADLLRAELAGPDRTLYIAQAAGGGPPAGQAEVRLISEDYDLLKQASDSLIGPLSAMDGVINVRTDAVDISDAGPFASAAIPITRVDGRRTVTISGVITAQDTRTVSAEIDRIVAEVGLPPGVERETGGVFLRYRGSVPADDLGHGHRGGACLHRHVAGATIIHHAGDHPDCRAARVHRRVRGSRDYTTLAQPARAHGTAHVDRVGGYECRCADRLCGSTTGAGTANS